MAEQLQADALKERAREVVLEHADELVQLSHAISERPELGFQEFHAVELISSVLVRAGYQVEQPYLGLDTAFRCDAGSKGPAIVVCAEYDALPEIGHACGHNMIAAMAVGAFLAMATVADEVPLTARLLGTPGEEVGEGCGKTLLVEREAFEGAAAAMMAHPAPTDVARPWMVAGASLDIRYHGRASHASYYPELGVNAADALTIAQVSIGLLRQHIRASDQIHGITTSAGDAPNIVPAESTAQYWVRGRNLADLEELLPRVRSCFEAGAIATGAALELSGGVRPYADMNHDPRLSEMYMANAKLLGRPIENETDRPSGSTDMGNVSHVVPSIHPLLGIGSWPTVNHQPQFADCAVSKLADEALLDGAALLAWTAIDFARSPQALAVKEEAPIT